jgi:hypothetical protein
MSIGKEENWNSSRNLGALTEAEHGDRERILCRSRSPEGKGIAKEKGCHNRI